ncbi:MAG: transglycosylase domain-containing protein, partial [Peptostreptococcaceae bacterium]
MKNNNKNNNKVRQKPSSTSNNLNRNKTNNAKKNNPSNSTNKTETKKVVPNKKSNKSKIFQFIGITILILIVLGVAGATALVSTSLKNVQPVTKAYLDQKTYTPSRIDYTTGELMTNVHSVNKKDPISIDQMPNDLINAIVAIEDQRFYTHNGVDLKGLLSAAVKNVLGMGTPGGSTIPMQISKMLITTTDKNITRKIQDIYYAFDMSKTLTKNEILEVYLNNFFVGRGLVGVQAGATGYFSKEAKELTLAESALLAGVTKYPTKFAPYNTAKLDGSETKETVENKLLFYINTEDDNLDDPTEIELQTIDKLEEWGLLDEYDSNEDLYKKLKSGAMVVRKAVQNPEAIDRRNTVLYKMHELGYINDEQYQTAQHEEINIKLAKPDDIIESSVESYIESQVISSLVKHGHTEDEAINMYYNGGLTISSTIDPKIQEIVEDEYKNNSNFPGHQIGPDGISQPQSSSVIIDYRSGHIKALIGGRNITDRKTLNRAITPKQPGSTIKPLTIYTPVIDSLKLTQSTIFSDAEGGYKFNYGTWSPKTTTAGSGNMSLRLALAKSSNTIAVKAAETLGDTQEEVVDVMIDYLRNFGVTTIAADVNDRNMPALTLGGMTNGISTLELAAAYGAIANEGVYIEPIIFTTITSYDGQLIVKNTPESHKVIDPEVAYVITDMLQAVVTEGTGRRAQLSNMPSAGKTGTTNGSLETWFAGYTPYYVAAIHIGDDKGVINPDTGSYIAQREVSTGSAAPTQLWGNIMSQVHKNLVNTNFKVPENIYFSKINLDDGGISSSGSNAAFINGTAPSRNSSVTTTVQPSVVAPSVSQTPQTQWTPDPTPEWTPDPTPEWTPDPTPEWTPDPTPEWTPDPAPEW